MGFRTGSACSVSQHHFSGSPNGTVDGSRRPNLSVFALRALPQAQFEDTWDAAATPDGGMVTAAIVGYSKRLSGGPVKCLLLTYDRSGKLTKVWNAAPYHHQKIAVDADGNVFALGHRGDMAGSYPMLIKYSPDGAVLGKFLDSGLFEGGSSAIFNPLPIGETEMFIRGQELFVWVASTQELFKFTLAGDLESRSSLVPAIRHVVDHGGYANAQIASLSSTSTGKLMAQAMFWTGGATEKPIIGMVAISDDGLRGDPISPVSTLWDVGRFLGVAKNDQMMFLELESGGIPVVRAH